MASLVSRLVVCLVAVVAVLQLVHLVLLNQLEERRFEELHHLHTQSAGSSASDVGGSAAVDKETSRRLDSINNGPQPPQLLSLPRLPHRSNELLHLNVNKLREGENVEDVGGEFRILYDVTGLRGTETAGVFSGDDRNKKQDDFVIDEVNIIDKVEELDVTLITQSNLQNMKQYLFSLIERWEGPLSLTLWIQNENELENGLSFIAQARHCHDLTKRFISFHIVFPLAMSMKMMTTTKNESAKNQTIQRNTMVMTPPHLYLNVLNEKMLKQSSKNIDKMCQNFFYDLSKMRSVHGSDINVNYDRKISPFIYPINLLRNVGRKKIVTRFSLVSDIDLIPSSKLRIKFQRFVKDKDEFWKEGGRGSEDERKIVFVIPAFERKEGGGHSSSSRVEEIMPETKSQLLTLIEKYQARPFYFDLCWKCQVHTDYEAWQRETSREELSVLFEVLWKDPWEPFFISDNSIPFFDERFRQYGFNRLSQLCELHMGGYKFAVLNDAFLIHNGYEIPNGFHAGKSRDVERNRLHFRHFKNEMRSKYPHSTRRCY